MLPVSFLIVTVIQIIAEMLPISSSGHVRLFQLLSGAPVLLPKYFDEFLHVFSLLVLAIFFRHTWVPLLRRLWKIITLRSPSTTLKSSNALESFETPFRLLRTSAEWRSKPLVLRKRRSRCLEGFERYSQQRFLHLTLKLITLITIVTLCTAAGYYGSKFIGAQLPWLSSPTALALGFAVTALLLITSNRTLIRQPSFPLLIICMALAQSLAALLPGVSRFAITYTAARWLGRTPRRALQLSWLLITPLITVAVAVNGLGDFMLGPDAGMVLQPAFWIASAAATAASYAALCGVAQLAQRNKLWWIGVYMLVPISTLVILKW